MSEAKDSFGIERKQSAEKWGVHSSIKSVILRSLREDEFFTQAVLVAAQKLFLLRDSKEVIFELHELCSEGTRPKKHFGVLKETGLITENNLLVSPLVKKIMLERIVVENNEKIISLQAFF